MIRSFLLAATILAATPVLAAERPVRFAENAPAEGSLVVPLAAAADLEARTPGLDAASRAAVVRAVEAAGFEYRRGATLSLRGIGPWREIVLIGTGAEPLDAAAAQDIGGTAVQQATDDGPVVLAATGLEALAPDMAVGAMLGGYGFDRYKSDRTAARPQPITIVGRDAATLSRGYDGRGQALVDAVRFTRDLVSEPANILYPESFVARTREAFQGVANVRIEAMDVPAMQRLGMGAILGVGQGSPRPPRMLVVRYNGGGSDQPIVLAGKGITFDSGGTSIKPSAGMWAMKGDMAGAAAIVGATLSLARSRAPVNVVAIAALAENMPGGDAQRPGDVVTTFGGKTIEIINTDAEGRLVLADAVAWADRELNPAAIVDVATLTGSVGGALGDDYAGLFSRHDALADQLEVAGRTTGEHLWKLPLGEGLSDTMSSEIADIQNAAEGGRPGASLGAYFIGFFIRPETPWAHLDIAGKEMSGRATPTAPSGATGHPVRLLDRFVRDYRPVARGAGTGGR